MSWGTSLTSTERNARTAGEDRSAGSQDAIIAAAERVFATYGFHGASMRMIAKESGISQALLHYHFKSKDRLYEEIFARRARVINGYRAELLEDLFRREKKPTLEMVLDVLFRPAAEALGSANQSEAFSHMVSVLVASADDRSRDLMISHYDPIAKKFIQAFRQLKELDLSEEDAVLAYLFAHSTRMQIYAPAGRWQRITQKRMTEIHRKSIVHRAVNYTAAGIRALPRIDHLVS